MAGECKQDDSLGMSKDGEKYLLTPEELGEVLGISVHTIYSKTSRRNREHTKVELPPFIKIGKLVRFPWQDFLEWLRKQERHHVSEE